MRQAHILAQATSNLVNAIKADAEGETDLENSRKLLSAAKILADATAKMVEAAKIRGTQEELLEQRGCFLCSAQLQGEVYSSRGRSCTELMNKHSSCWQENEGDLGSREGEMTFLLCPGSCSPPGQ